jgi:hypothetical protein
MKRYTFITTLFSVSILAVWMIFQLFTASQTTVKNDTLSLRLQSSQNESIKAAVPVTGVEARTVAPAPVYDASGRIVSLNPNGASSEAVILPPAANMKVAPVYDTSGTLVSDPSGVLRTTHNAKIAPVFDATGKVISDPTGTILSGSNP